jgi:cytoskeleton protein RodZ
MSAENDNNDTAARRRIHLREISGDSENPLETVGAELRAARLRRGDEIAQVSRALKIRKDHLEALENDRLEDLPGKTYAVGFVRSYARHLGLDAAQYVERFKREIAGRADDQAREPAPIHQDDRRLPYGWRLVAGIVAVLLIWGGWRCCRPAATPISRCRQRPVLTTPKPAPRRPAAGGGAAQTAVPSPAADAAPPHRASDNRRRLAARRRAAAATCAATRSTPPRQSPPPRRTSVDPASAPQSGPCRRSAVCVGQVLRRREPQFPRGAARRGDTRVTVKGPDGQILLNRDLKSGDSYQVPDMPGVTMATSDAGAVEVDLDGIALGRAGQAQQIVGRVSLDPRP